MEYGINVRQLQAHIYKNKLDEMRLRLKKRIEDELFMDQLDIECSCCYSSKAIEEFSRCESNHNMCVECIQKHAETTIYENGKFKITCITSEEVCGSLYSDKVLEKILNKKVYDQYQRLKTKEETKYIFSMEGMNLIKCQFCETYWDADKNEKVLYCRECKKSTCLECNQLEHKGTPCDKLRIQIEEGLTKQNFLICGSCTRCIFKEEGCNAVRCPCGNNMCWGCKQNWGATDAHGCTCKNLWGASNGTNDMAEFATNAEAQAYINKLR